MDFIPYGRQCLGPEEREALLKVLDGDHLTQGPLVARFESALADYCGARYAVAVSHGTAALYLAAQAVDLEGRRAVTSPLTFCATANAVIQAGGTPVFADIGLKTRNLDPRSLAGALEGGNVGAVLPVDYAGHPCELEAIAAAARKAGALVIEDAAHALGASYRGEKIGGSRFADLTVFSFHPVKSITTGEGGAILTDRKDLYERLLVLRNHGIVKTPELAESVGPWYYEQRALSGNYRITDLQCALGLAQLVKLDLFVQLRRELVQRYRARLAGRPAITLPPPEDDDHRSAHHLFAVRIDFAGLKRERQAVMRELAARGIGTQVHYIPVYHHPYYRRRFPGQALLPRTEEFYAGALSLPLYPELQPEQVDRVAAELLSALGLR